MRTDNEPFCCAKCGNPFVFADRVGLRESCPRCDADLHTCHNCRHFDTHVHNECREPQADWVREKDRANHCDYFDPRRGQRGPSGWQSEQSKAKARFEDLFKK